MSGFETSHSSNQQDTQIEIAKVAVASLKNDQTCLTTDQLRSMDKQRIRLTGVSSSEIPAQTEFFEIIEDSLQQSRESKNNSFQNSNDVGSQDTKENSLHDFKESYLQHTKEGNLQQTKDNTFSQTRKSNSVCPLPCTTGYIDNAISNTRSVSSSLSEMSGETVTIPRAEIMQIMKQTLEAQTMYNYMHSLVQTNQILNRQNKVMKETIVQMNNSYQSGERRGADFASLQPPQAEVFCFDQYSPSPNSLPSVQDKTANGSGSCHADKPTKIPKSSKVGPGFALFNQTHPPVNQPTMQRSPEPALFSLTDHNQTPVNQPTQQGGPESALCNIMDHQHAPVNQPTQQGGSESALYSITGQNKTPVNQPTEQGSGPESALCIPQGLQQSSQTVKIGQAGSDYTLCSLQDHMKQPSSQLTEKAGSELPCCSPLDKQKQDHKPDNEASPATILVHSDGDCTESSRTMSICVSFDGDLSPQSKEASAAAGNGNSGGAASNFIPGAGLGYNIPTPSLLDTAPYYRQQEEVFVGAGVPLERHELVTDELEKMKLFLHKIATEGGVHPNNLSELASLRKEVEKLRIENDHLKADIKNPPIPLLRVNGSNQQALLEIQTLHSKLASQRKVEDRLLQEFKKLKDENKRLIESRPMSQPTSSVGMPALPTIPDLQREAGSKYSELRIFKLQQENQQLKKLYDEGKESKAQIKKEVEDFKSQLKKVTQEKDTFLKELQDRTTHNKELGSQMTGLNSEIDKLKRALLQESERCKELEKMIEDERKRWSRDEKKLLDQVRKDVKDIQKLEELVLALDKPCDGTPLQPSQYDHLVLLREQRGSGRLRHGSAHSNAPAHSSTSTHCSKIASSKSGATAATGANTLSSHARQHNQSHSASGNANYAATLRQPSDLALCSPQGHSLGQGPTHQPLQGFLGKIQSRDGSSSSRVRHETQPSGVSPSPKSGPHASLPSMLPHQHHQHSDSAAMPPPGNTRLQRSNIGGSSPEMLNPIGGSARHKLHDH